MTSCSTDVRVYFISLMIVPQLLKHCVSSDDTAIQGFVPRILAICTGGEENNPDLPGIPNDACWRLPFSLPRIFFAFVSLSKSLSHLSSGSWMVYCKLTPSKFQPISLFHQNDHDPIQQRYDESTTIK